MAANTCSDIHAFIAKEFSDAGSLGPSLFSLAHSFSPASDEKWWRSACGSALILNAKVALNGQDAFSAARHNHGLQTDQQQIGGSDAGLDYIPLSAGVRWVHADRALIAQRDILGQTPLFHCDLGRFYAISTSLVWIKGLLDRPPLLDREAAFNYLAFGVPGLGRTLLSAIRKVPAAHSIRFQSGQPPIVSRYWTPLTSEISPPNTQQAKKRIEATLAESASRFHSEATALLLSGGIDSGYLAAIYKGLDITGYTIDFPESDIPSEAALAAETAAYFGVNHKLVSLDTETAIVRLDEVLNLWEPCSAWSNIVHTHLIDQVRLDKQACVVSGLGADEMFGSYNPFLDYYRRFREFTRQGAFASPTDALRAALRSTQTEDLLFPGIPTFFDQKQLEATLVGPLNKWKRGSEVPSFYLEALSMKPHASFFELMTAYECQHRIPDLLITGFEQVHRSHGIDAIYPFLTPGMLREGCGLTPVQKLELRDGQWKGKRIFRDIARQVLPSFIIDRKVRSYNAPLLAWMSDKRFFTAAHCRLMDSSLWKLGLLRGDLRDNLDCEIKIAVSRPNGDHMALLFRYWIVLTLGGCVDKWGAV